MDRALIEATLYYLLERAAAKLRSERMMARTVRVKVRFSDFSTRATSRSFPAPKCYDADFFELVLKLLPRLLTRRISVRLVGVALSGLVGGAWRQGDLLSEGALLRKSGLYRSIDRIRKKYGFSALHVGRSASLLKHMEREHDGFVLRTTSLSQ